jgi:hypothetical protein
MDFSALINAIKSFFQFLIDWIVYYFFEFLKWAFDAVEYAFNKFIQVFFEAAGHIIGAIPAPGFADDACSAYSSIPDTIIWILGYAQFGAGVTAIFSAYGIRFLIRRIPVVG